MLYHKNTPFFLCDPVLVETNWMPDEWMNGVAGKVPNDTNRSHRPLKQESPNPPQPNENGSCARVFPRPVDPDSHAIFPTNPLTPPAVSA